MPIVSGIPTRCVTHDLDFPNHNEAMIHCYEVDNTTHELHLDIEEGVALASPDPERIKYV